jgi:hypothetical protein
MIPKAVHVSELVAILEANQLQNSDASYPAFADAMLGLVQAEPQEELLPRLLRLFNDNTPFNPAMATLLSYIDSYDKALRIEKQVEDIDYFLAHSHTYLDILFLGLLFLETSREYLKQKYKMETIGTRAKIFEVFKLAFKEFHLDEEHASLYRTELVEVFGDTVINYEER